MAGSDLGSVNGSSNGCNVNFKHNENCYNTQRLKMVTYNLHGIKQGEHFLLELLLNHDIICVQEHWLSVAEFNKLIDFNKDFTVIATSAMEDKLCRGVLHGRPFGGLAVFIRNSTIKQKLYTVYKNERCIILCVNELMIINVYMPCNDGAIFEEALRRIREM